MFKLFSNIPITFGQMCIFKTSVTAEITINGFQAVSILKSLPSTDYAYTCVNMCVYIPLKMRKGVEWIMIFFYLSIVQLFVIGYFCIVLHFSTTPKSNICVFFFLIQIPVKNRSYKILISTLLLWTFFSSSIVSQFLASVKTREKVVRKERYRREENRVMEIQFKMQTNLPFLLDSL